MAIRWSPGCRCCGPQGCGEFTLEFTPSSPLSRGEYDHLDYWQPFTEYLMGERFLMQHLDPDSEGTNRTYVWEVTEPSTFSGPGWTYFEMSRYTDVTVVDYLDRPEEWIPYGAGWPNDPIEMERLVSQKRIPSRCGYISAEDVVENPDWRLEFEWSPVALDSDPFGGLPTDLEMEVDFIAAALFEGEDQEPTSGTLFTLDRNPNPFPAPDYCVSEQAIFDVTRGQLGTFTPQSKNYIGVSTYGNSVPTVDMCRSVQPIQGNVVTGFDFSIGTAEQPVDIFEFGPPGIPSSQFPDDRNKNRIIVATETGTYKQGVDGIPEAIGKGELLRVVDVEKLWNKEDGAFEKITADLIELIDILNAPQIAESSAMGQVVDGATLGTKVGIYVETINTPTNPEDSYVYFDGVRGSRTATIQSPDCHPCLEYACPCDAPLVTMASGGVDITDITQSPLIQAAIRPQRQTALLGNVAPEDSFTELSRGLDVLVGTTTPEPNAAQCQGYSGKYTIMRHWALNKEKGYDGFQNHAFDIWVRWEVYIAVAQLNAMNVRGLLGREVVVRAVTGVSQLGIWMRGEAQISLDTNYTPQEEQALEQAANQPIWGPEGLNDGQGNTTKSDVEKMLCNPFISSDLILPPGSNTLTSELLFFAGTPVAKGYIPAENWTGCNLAMQVQFSETDVFGNPSDDLPWPGETVTISSA